MKIKIANPVFNGNEKQYLNECIDTGWVSSNGRFIEAFQNKFAEFCGTKYAVACSNGTVSLHLALEALGIGKGDEVIMPTLTYIATANAVTYCGAKPVFADVETDTWNISTLSVEKVITRKTKAIIPVHLYGLPCDMDSIIEIAKKYNLKVIEDAAEAHGAKWKGKAVGSMGDIGSFSFFGNKIITSGEGGMLVTDNKELYRLICNLRSQGVDPNKRYWHDRVAYNYRMTNMQAAVGLAQLENVDWHLAQRQRVAKLYDEKLKGLQEYISVQKVNASSHHAFWMYSIVFTDKVKDERDQIMKSMEGFGIEMRPLFYPMHVMPPYYDSNVACPVAEKISERGINLPTHANLSESDIDYIVDCLKKIIAK